MAGFIEQSKLDELLFKADILSVAGSYVNLIKAGGLYKAICPFHNEKTPSLIITPSKGLFHCFGCGAGGNAINFIMKIENLSFIESVKLLAERYNVDINFDGDKKSTEEAKVKKRLYELNKDAANLFYINLKSSQSATGYINKRGLNNEIIKQFGIGYAKNEWDDLINNLSKKGYTKSEFLKSGLCIKSAKNENIYDKFRDRVMFPIQDVSGKVIGFGGRIINSKDTPKYLNTSETEIFIKGRHLYNLNRAKFHCKDYLILVEGYMDVIGLASKGIDCAVASLGTAFTRYQANLIKQYTNTVYLCYDSDSAGINAAIKNAQLLDDMGLDAKIIILKDAKDPDEYVIKFGKEKFLSLLENAVDVYIFKIITLKRSFKDKLTSDDGKSKFASGAIKIIQDIQDSIRIERYCEYISKSSGIAKGILKQQLEKNKQKNAGVVKVTINKKESVKPGPITAQEKIINILSNNSEIYQKYKNKIKNLEFNEGILKDILEFIIIAYDSEKKFNPSEFISLLNDENDIQYISKILLDDKFTDEGQLRGYINIISVDNINMRIKEKKSIYNNALKSNDIAAANEALMQINSLKRAVDLIKGGAI